MKKMQWTASRDQDIRGMILFPKLLGGHVTGVVWEPAHSEGSYLYIYIIHERQRSFPVFFISGSRGFIKDRQRSEKL